MSALPVEFDPVPGQSMPTLPVPIVPVLVPVESAAPAPAAPESAPAAPGAPAPAPAAPGTSVSEVQAPETPDTPEVADAASGAPGQAAPRLRATRSRRSGLRARPAARRSHLAGVRACSAVSLAQPPAVPPHPVQVPPRAATASPPLRLTGRGRSVVAACGVVVATLLWFAVATAAHASAHGAPATPAAAAKPALTRVVVQPGQTLWSIATAADPSADPRLVVQRIVTVNKLSSESVAAGQRLWVPRG
jgi:LysM domain